MTCAVAGLLAAAAIGCGGDDEATTAAPAPDPGATGPVPDAETAPTNRNGAGRRAADPDEREPSPPDAGAPRPGGREETRNADERVRTEVVLTARDGRIEPPLVRVPADVPIAVELRGGDAADELRIDGRSLRPGAPPLTLEPLSAGSSHSGRTRSGERVEISATAEPGP